MKKGLFMLGIIAVCLSACSTGEEKVSDATVSSFEQELVSVPEASPQEDFVFSKFSDGVILKAYIGDESEVIIPETFEGLKVKKVNSGLLSGKKVTEITYPSYYSEFTGLSGCDTLETINFSSALEKIPESFRFCSGLNEINIEEGGAFKAVDGVVYTADGKELVAFPRGIEGGFTVPDEVEVIGKYAFSGTSLNQIVLNDGLTEIADYAFYDCEGFSEIIIPESVKTIGFMAFSESGLKNVRIKEGLKEIKGSAFKNTKLSSLFLPDSVTELGFSVVDDDVSLSVPIISEGTRNAASLENAVFRNETMLDEAFRFAEERFGFLDKGVIFTDMTGDNFPEIIRHYGNSYSVYHYNVERRCWSEGAYSTKNMKYYLRYDSENELYICHSEKGEMWYTSEYFVPVQNVIKTDKNGMEIFWEYDDEIVDYSSYELIKTVDVSKLYEEQGIDPQEIYGHFYIITDRFSEEPFGWLQEKPISLDGRKINDFPFSSSRIVYPNDMKIVVNGVDILRNENENIYYKNGALVLDNAVIDVKDRQYVMETEGFDKLTIKLIGENRVVASSTCELLENTDTEIEFVGDGSFEVPKIIVNSLTLKDSVRLKTNKEYVYSYSWTGVERRCIVASFVVLDDRSSLETGTVYTSYLEVGDDSRYKGSDIKRFNAISVSGNGEIQLENEESYTDAISTERYGAEIILQENGAIKINGQGYNFGIMLKHSDNSRILLTDKSGIAVENTLYSCIWGENLEVSGGSLTLSSQDSSVIRIDMASEEGEGYVSDYVISGSIISESSSSKNRKSTDYYFELTDAVGEKLTDYSITVAETDDKI